MRSTHRKRCHPPAYHSQMPATASSDSDYSWKLVAQSRTSPEMMITQKPSLLPCSMHLVRKWNQELEWWIKPGTLSSDLVSEAVSPSLHQTFAPQIGLSNGKFHRNFRQRFSFSNMDQKRYAKAFQNIHWKNWIKNKLILVQQNFWKPNNFFFFQKTPFPWNVWRILVYLLGCRSRLCKSMPVMDLAMI